MDNKDSAAEQKCVKCGHAAGVDADGRCNVDGSGPRWTCYCHCVFSEAAASEGIPEKVLPCPWCGAESDAEDKWGSLITHTADCYWRNNQGDSIGRVRVNNSEKAKWNTRVRSDSPSVDAAVTCPCGLKDIPIGVMGVNWYWQRHARTGCTLELPNEKCWCGLLRSEHVTGHADPPIISPSVDEVAVRRAAEKIVEKTRCDEYRGGPKRTIMAADAIAEIISNELKNSDSVKVGTTPLTDVERSLLPTQESGLLPCPLIHESLGTVRLITTVISYDEVSSYTAEIQCCGGCGLTLKASALTPDVAVQRVTETWNTRYSDASKEVQQGNKTPDAMRVMGELLNCDPSYVYQQVQQLLARQLEAAEHFANCHSEVNKEADDYVAWCTYSHHEDGTTTISTCDSDTKGAFKVYRSPADASKEYVRGLEDAAQRCEGIKDGIDYEPEKVVGQSDTWTCRHCGVINANADRACVRCKRVN